MPPKTSETSNNNLTRKSSRTRILSSRAQPLDQGNPEVSVKDIPDSKTPERQIVKEPIIQDTMSPSVAMPRPSVLPLTSKRAGQAPTEDPDQVCTRHDLPVQSRLIALEQVINENPVPEESALKAILTRLSKIDNSSQIFTEIKYSLEAMKLQQTLPTLTETVNTIRRDVKHIMQINSNKKMKPTPDLNFITTIEKQK